MSFTTTTITIWSTWDEWRWTQQEKTYDFWNDRPRPGTQKIWDEETTMNLKNGKITTKKVYTQARTLMGA